MLPGSGSAALCVRKGMDIPAYPFTRMPKEDLRQFIFDLVDGKVFTSAHLDSQASWLMRSVFMPIAFDALKPTDEVRALMPDDPPEPKAPVLPPEPPRPPDPILPPAPAEPSPPGIPSTLLRDVDWGRLSPAELEPYQQDIQQHQQVMEEWQQARTLWEAECAQIQAEYAAKIAHWETYSKDEWRAECDRLNADFDQRHREWEALHKANSAERGRIFAAHFRDLGIIWERIDRAGPRSINGYPMFMSCHLMHREDWEKARKAAVKEQERRQQVDLGLEDGG